MFHHLVNLFFPKVCLGCKTYLLDKEIFICTSCRYEMPYTNFHLYPNNEAYQKFYGKVEIEFVATLLYFQKKGVVQELIHNLKYRGHQEIGTLFGNWYSEDLKNIEILKSIDLIVPVPIHKKRLKLRGYNQVTTFGEALSKNLKKPFNETILNRNIFSKTQVFKDLITRSDVNEALFGINFGKELHDKHFLLIDDVLTSGATLEACTRNLQKIPGAKVSIICMAMTH